MKKSIEEIVCFKKLIHTADFGAAHINDVPLYKILIDKGISRLYAVEGDNRQINLLKKYIDREFDVVDVIYNEFISVGSQRIIAKKLLPIEYDSEKKVKSDIIYEPSKESIVKTLIPKHLNVQLWQFLLESNASEQAARMVAMENATDNAGEMISDLSIEYNKARQAAITTEIIEIVSGANALEG